jgi:hypothetical protein
MSGGNVSAPMTIFSGGFLVFAAGNEQPSFDN